MTICAAILSPIVTTIRVISQVVREIVRTICEWVATVIKTIKTVVEEVCEWVTSKICKNLPWPLNKLCDWVTKFVCKIVITVIEVFEVVWEFVCTEIIERIIDLVEIVFEYIVYIFKWVCWVIDWIIRGPALLLCMLGIEPQKYLGVCVKILADNDGNPAIPVADVREMLRDAAGVLRRCNIALVPCSIEIVRKPEYLNSTTCEVGGMFRRFFTWFSSNTCSCCTTVTVYIVRDIVNPPGRIVSGCAYPGTDWVTVDAEGDGTVIVQEIGHLADLWGHSSDPDNVMTDQPGGIHDQITKYQCCMIRTSRFSRTVPPCEFSRLPRATLSDLLERSVSAPFARKDRGRRV